MRREWAMGKKSVERKCKDGGVCHHNCKVGDCFLETHCLPLTKLRGQVFTLDRIGNIGFTEPFLTAERQKRVPAEELIKSICFGFVHGIPPFFILPGIGK